MNKFDSHLFQTRHSQYCIARVIKIYANVGFCISIYPNIRQFPQTAQISSYAEGSSGGVSVSGSQLSSKAPAAGFNLVRALMFGVKPSSIAISGSVGQRYARFATEKVPRLCSHVPYSSLVYSCCMRAKRTHKVIQQLAIVHICTSRPRNSTVPIPTNIPPLCSIAAALSRTSDCISPGIVILKIACVISSLRVGACIAIFSPISPRIPLGDGSGTVDTLAVINAHVPDSHVQNIVAPHECIRVERNMHVHDDPSVGACCVAAIPVVGPGGWIRHARCASYPEGQLEDHLVAATGSRLEPPKIVEREFTLIENQARSIFGI